MCGIDTFDAWAPEVEAIGQVELLAWRLFLTVDKAFITRRLDLHSLNEIVSNLYCHASLQSNPSLGVAPTLEYLNFPTAIIGLGEP
jgi:hypothetical protein